MNHHSLLHRFFVCLALLALAGCSFPLRPQPSAPTPVLPGTVQEGETPTGQPIPAEPGLTPAPATALPPVDAGPLPTSGPTAEPVGLPGNYSALPLVGVFAPDPPPEGVTTAPGALNVWVHPDLPAGLRNRITLPQGWGLAPEASAAALRIEPGSERPISQWVYALVAPFPTLVEGVSLAELQAAWQGAPVGPFAGRPLWMEASTQAALATLWGPPAAGAVALAPAEALVDQAWGSRPAWGIVPFEALEPRWKVLTVDGRSPLRKDFDPAAYPLSAPVSLSGERYLADAMLTLFGPASAAPLVPLTNRDPNRLTTVAMTGVTALVRATAHTMERQGVLYPGQDVGDWLRNADLTHISNEVPFAEDCPAPDPVQQDMRFCSAPRYIGLLEDMGTDIVELTGDHFQDWGAAAMYHTLDLYRERGWGYYGGGANADEARAPLLIEHNGNRLAFIGCNAKGGGYAQAGPDRPGAIVCGDWMQSEIARLRSEGYLPIATFQHFEYYTYQARPNQVRDSRSMAEAGAVIVSGSQAHQPQGLEFHAGAFIHYGLGNLFFDQYDVSFATRQGFIDRHVFYDGRYLGTELLPILLVDYARPRPMTPDERSDLLQAVFRASDW